MRSVTKHARNLLLMLLTILIGLFSLASCGVSDKMEAPSPSAAISSGNVHPIIIAELDCFPTGSVPPGMAPSGTNSIATIAVWDDISGATISGATVLMNGAALTYNSATQMYEGSLNISPGAAVTLDVTVNGRIYSASGTHFTTYPSISSPSPDATWYMGAQNTIAWTGGGPTASKSVIGYYLGVLDLTNPGNLVWPSNNLLQMASLSLTSYVIPANSLTAGSRGVMVGLYQEVYQSDNATYLIDIIMGAVSYVPVTVQ